MASDVIWDTQANGGGIFRNLRLIGAGIRWWRRKTRWASTIPVVCVVGFFVGCGTPDQQSEQEIQMLAPAEGQVVGSAGVPLLAASGDRLRTDFRPTFEYSTDGLKFTPIDGEPGPDYGPGLFVMTLDSTLFPSGPLLLRAAEGGAASDSVRVLVNRLPVPACRVMASDRDVTVDCSESHDPDGEISYYEWDFGDGEVATTVDPTIVHRYADAGTFALGVAVFDSAGMFETWHVNIHVAAAAMITAMVPPPRCECKEMLVKARGNSTLPDLRRPAPGGAFGQAPLGPDPMWPTVNFEIEASLTDTSDPDLCTEGQKVKTTWNYSDRRLGRPRRGRGFKKACSAGLPFPNCNINPDCDIKKCRGARGIMNNKECHGAILSPAGKPLRKDILCAIQGGRCVVTTPGICTGYPSNGATRGEDDYRKHYPLDEGTKVVDRTKKQIRWFDAPGLLTKRPTPQITFVQTSDFHAFVHGDVPGAQKCECHFKMLIRWLEDINRAVPGWQPGHDSARGRPRPGVNISGFELIRDGETTRNCRLIQ